jgi:hypothetical protein
MIKYLKILFLGMIVMGLLSGPAVAAILTNSQNATFSSSNVNSSYKIAYEVYSESAGVSTIASRGVIKISLGQTLSVGESANLVIPGLTAGGIEADFNSSGANFKWILRRVTADVPAVTDPIIGITPSAGLVTPNLPFSIITNAVKDDVLWVQQIENWVNPGGNLIGTLGVDYTSLVAGAGIYVRTNAGATCTNQKIVKLTFSTPHETTVSPVNFAYITPQFGVSAQPGVDYFTAELNTDTDFFTFVMGTGPRIVNPTQISISNFLQLQDNSGSVMWIAFAQVTPTGTISFNINSLVGELDTSIYLDGNFCSESGDSKTFFCSANTTLTDPQSVNVNLSGSSINEPTIWSLSNFSVSVGSGLGIKDLCVSVGGGGIGVWYGGLEAFVPFVKGTEDRSYQTYIKLFNRYNKDAKVFVSTFADVPGGSAEKIMVSTDQLPAPNDMIPAGGMITINDQDIGAFVSGYDMSKGLPVKFNIRVPSQMGTTTYSGTSGGSIYIYSYPFGDYSGVMDGSVMRQNPYDPFVEGIVMSVYPGGGQRSIPLKFKSFKNGEYNH